MLAPFFAVGMKALNRQQAFRAAAACHVAIVAAVAWFVGNDPIRLPGLGHGLVIVGIVEGATLIGWRLTQVPKSQSMEFLLVSPVQPARVFLAEAAVGLTRLAWVTLSGLPVLTVLAATGRIGWDDVAVLLVVPWVWGAITGIGLTAWAYESVRIRRFGEVGGLIVIMAYLIIGVLVAEKLFQWLSGLPSEWQAAILNSLRWVHFNNPFGQMLTWFDRGHNAFTDWPRIVGLQAASLMAVALMTARASLRLRGHFHDRHYRPLSEVTPADTRGIRDRPLSWWAVRRVMEYSGRSNLYLAGGFSVLFAAYTVAGQSWPSWLGTGAFQIIERAGGIAVVAAGLVLMAAVPAAFQYGLWDSSTQERCRRLELLLLTELDAGDYWRAAAAAAWKRGRGYLYSAAILWLAAGVAGRAGWWQVGGAAVAGGLLLATYFAVGFWSFSGGYQAGGLGSLLTIGVPLTAYGLYQVNWPTLAGWTPPGSVYAAISRGVGGAWVFGPVAMAVVAAWVMRSSARTCDADLRAWYDRNSGRKSLD